MDKGRGLWTAGRAGLLASVLGLLSFVHPFAAQAASSDYSGWRKSDGTPQSVMLSYYDGPDTRGFAWQTSTSVSSGALWLLRGEWDSSTGNFDTNQVATATSTKQSTECYTHKAYVTGLVAGVWSYRLGTASHYAYGKFVVRDGTAPFVAVNITDIQLKSADKLSNWKNVVTAADAVLGGGANADTIISCGDFFDQTNPSGYSRYVCMGVTADQARPEFADVAWTMASGNHDTSYYKACCAENCNSAASSGGGCHSYDYGNVHVATIPYATSLSSSVESWLKNDLAAAQDAQWRILVTHFGPYTTGDHGYGATSTYVQKVSGLCATYKVDLVLQGHDHTYSKTLPYLWSGKGYASSTTDSTAVNLKPATVVIGGETYYDKPEGTVYVSAGCAGDRVGENTTYASTTYKNRSNTIVTDKVNVKSTYANVGDDGSKDVGKPMFAVLTADDATLKFDWYVAASATPELFDTLRISKAPPEPPHDEDETITLAQDGTKTITTIASQEVWNYEITSGVDCISVVCEPNDDFTANFTFTGVEPGTATVVIYQEDGTTPLKTVTVTVLPPDPMTTPIKTTFNRATVTTVGAVINATDPSGDLILIYTNTAAQGSLTLEQDESARVLVVGGGAGGVAGKAGKDSSRSTDSRRYTGNGGNSGEAEQFERALPAGQYAITVGKGGSSATPAIESGTSYYDFTGDNPGQPSSVAGPSDFTTLTKNGGTAWATKNDDGSGAKASSKTASKAQDGSSVSMISDISGIETTYAVGGTGGSSSSAERGADATPGTGNGGGGSSGGTEGADSGAGGSGIVVVRIARVVEPIDMGGETYVFERATTENQVVIENASAFEVADGFVLTAEELAKFKLNGIAGATLAAALGGGSYTAGTFVLDKGGSPILQGGTLGFIQSGTVSGITLDGAFTVDVATGATVTFTDILRADGDRITVTGGGRIMFADDVIPETGEPDSSGKLYLCVGDKVTLRFGRSSIGSYGSTTWTAEAAGDAIVLNAKSVSVSGSNPANFTVTAQNENSSGVTLTVKRGTSQTFTYTVYVLPARRLQVGEVTQHWCNTAISGQVWALSDVSSGLEAKVEKTVGNSCLVSLTAKSLGAKQTVTATAGYATAGSTGALLGVSYVLTTIVYEPVTPVETVFDGQTVTTVGAAVDTMSVPGELILVYTNTEEPGSLEIPEDAVARILVVGGGAGGVAGKSSTSNKYNGNGGNGGTASEGEYDLPAGTYSITVGAGGAGAAVGSTDFTGGGAGGKSSMVPNAGVTGFSKIEQDGGEAWPSQDDGGSGTKDKGGTAAENGSGANLTSEITGESYVYGKPGIPPPSDQVTKAYDGKDADEYGAGGQGSANGGTSGAGGNGIVIVRISGFGETPPGPDDPPVDPEDPVTPGGSDADVTLDSIAAGTVTNFTTASADTQWNCVAKRASLTGESASDYVTATVVRNADGTATVKTEILYSIDDRVVVGVYGGSATPGSGTLVKTITFQKLAAEERTRTIKVGETLNESCTFYKARNWACDITQSGTILAASVNTASATNTTLAIEGKAEGAATVTVSRTQSGSSKTAMYVYHVTVIEGEPPEPPAEDEQPTDLSPSTMAENPIALLTEVQTNYLYTKTIDDRCAAAQGGQHAELFCYGSPVVLSWKETTGSCAVSVKRLSDGKVVGTGDASGTSVTVHNLELGAGYEWTVTSKTSGLSASATFYTSDMPPRLIKTGLIKNLRDLGGWTGLQGCKIRQNLLFRGGAADNPKWQEQGTPAYLIENDSDRDFLCDVVGLKNEVDLRDKDTSSDWADRNSVNYKFDPTDEHVTYNNYSIANNALPTNGEIVKVWKLLMTPAKLPAYFHCKSGRDRTGIVAAVLLAALGVSRDDIVRDFQTTSDKDNWTKYGFNTILDTSLAKYKDANLSLADNAKAYLMDCGFSDDEVEDFREALLVDYERQGGETPPVDPPVDPTDEGEQWKSSYTIGTNETTGVIWCEYDNKDRWWKFDGGDASIAAPVFVDANPNEPKMSGSHTTRAKFYFKSGSATGTTTWKVYTYTDEGEQTGGRYPGYSTTGGSNNWSDRSGITITITVTGGETPPGPDDPDDPPVGEPAKFCVTPYLQRPASDAMTILFFTDQACGATVTCGNQTNATVGVWAQALTNNVNAGDSSVWNNKLYRHRVRFEGLKANRSYDYTVTLAGGATYSDTFRTAPDRNTPIRFVSYADCETTKTPFDNYVKNLQRMQDRDPDFITVSGDLVARGGLQENWDGFWQANAGAKGTIAGSIPVITVIGNHDLFDNGLPKHGSGLYYDMQGEPSTERFLSYFEVESNGVDFAHAPAPHTETRDLSQLFHRVDYGPVTLIFLDTNNGQDGDTDADHDKDTNYLDKDDGQHLEGGLDRRKGCRHPDFNVGSPQYVWLTNNLAEAQAKSRFTFVFNHHCPYSRGTHNRSWNTGEDGSALALRFLTETFVRYGVDGWYCGHDELLEHSVTTGDEVLPDGTTRPHTLSIYDLGGSGDPSARNSGSETNPLEYNFMGNYSNGYYGFLETDVTMDEQGRWTCTVTPYSSGSKAHMSDRMIYVEDPERAEGVNDLAYAQHGGISGVSTTDPSTWGWTEWTRPPEGVWDESEPVVLASATVEEAYATGSVLTPRVRAFTTDGRVIPAGYYTVSVNPPEPKEIGTYEVTVTGKGNVSGSVTAEFRIVKATIPLPTATEADASFSNVPMGTVEKVTTTSRADTWECSIESADKDERSICMEASVERNEDGTATVSVNCKYANGTTFTVDVDAVNFAGERKTVKKIKVNKIVAAPAVEIPLTVGDTFSVDCPFGAAEPWKLSTSASGSIVEAQLSSGANESVATTKLSVTARAAGTETVTVIRVNGQYSTDMYVYTFVVKAGPTPFDYLCAAAAAGEAYVIEDDMEFPADGVLTVPAGTSFVLDLRGHAIVAHADGAIVNHGTLTILDSTKASPLQAHLTYTATETGKGYALIRSDGELVVDGAFVDAGFVNGADSEFGGGNTAIAATGGRVTVKNGAHVGGQTAIGATGDVAVIADGAHVAGWRGAAVALAGASSTLSVSNSTLEAEGRIVRATAGSATIVDSVLATSRTTAPFDLGFGVSVSLIRSIYVDRMAKWFPVTTALANAGADLKVGAGCLLAVASEGVVGFLDEGVTAAEVASHMWRTKGADDEALPSLTPEEEAKIAEVLSSSPDALLKANVTTIEDYTAYKTWVDAGVASGAIESEAAAKGAAGSFFSFATAQPGIVDTAAITEEKVKVKEVKVNNGGVTLTVGIQDLPVGEGAKQEYLEQVFGVTGTGSLEKNDFAAEKVVYKQDMVRNADGTVSYTVEPKVEGGAARPDEFYFKAKVNK